MGGVWFDAATASAVFWIIVVLLFSHVYGIPPAKLDFVQGAGMLVMGPLTIIQTLSTAFGWLGPIIVLLASVAFFGVLPAVFGEINYGILLVLAVIFLVG